MNNKNITIGLIVTLIIAIIGLVLPRVANKVGSITTNLPSIGLVDLSVGSNCGDNFTTCNGTDLTHMIATQCTSFTASTLATGDGVAQAASTTKAYDCAVTNVVAGDRVIAQFATSTPITTTAGSNYWAIIGAKASTTAGFVSLLIYNNGPSAVPSALGVGSSTNIWIFK